MIRYHVTVKKVDGRASARVEKHELGAFVKYVDVMEHITELELSRKELIEEFAEAECMGDLAKIARNHGYEEQE